MTTWDSRVRILVGCTITCAISVYYH